MSQILSQSLTNSTCPACGINRSGKFCHSCGEKTFHPEDLSIKKFFLQTVDVFTHLDTKFIKSVKYLLFYPGFLTKEYLKGIRVKYAKPMQIFLLANLFFYFITHTFKVTDYSPNFGDHHFFYLSEYWIFSWAQWLDELIVNGIDQLSEWKSSKLGLSEKQIIPIFSQNSWIYSKLCVILLIPMEALVFWIFFRKRMEYFGSALLFAVHFVAFQLTAFSIYCFFHYGLGIRIFFPLSWLIFDSPLKFLTQFFISDGFEFINLVLWFPYLYFAVQRLKKMNVWLTLGVCFLVSKIIYFVTFGIYKKALITITLLLMH